MGTWKSDVCAKPLLRKALQSVVEWIGCELQSLCTSNSCSWMHYLFGFTICAFLFRIFFRTWRCPLGLRNKLIRIKWPTVNVTESLCSSHLCECNVSERLFLWHKHPLGLLHELTRIWVCKDICGNFTGFLRHTTKCLWCSLTAKAKLLHLTAKIKTSLVQIEKNSYVYKQKHFGSTVLSSALIWRSLWDTMKTSSACHCTLSTRACVMYSGLGLRFRNERMFCD